MKVSDMTNGPEWVGWAVLGMLAVMSLVLLSGHGSGLIAGYNTSTKEEKEKYDEKKLCRVAGGGLAVICILIAAMLLFETVLPSCFVYVTLVVILTDTVITIILCNTICKKH